MFWYAYGMPQDLYGLYHYSINKICPQKDILYTRLTEKLFDKNTQQPEKKNMIKPNTQKEITTKLTKGLLDMIILQDLQTQPMHGYQIITKIRKDYGIYFGPSTIYPLLATLEKKGYVASAWSIDTERPRKTYKLTNDGQNILTYTEESLNHLCRKITIINPETEQTIGMIKPSGTALTRKNIAKSKGNPLIESTRLCEDEKWRSIQPAKKGLNSNLMSWSWKNRNSISNLQ